MLSIGSVQLGNVPRVVLGVSGDDPALAQARAAGVDILELRIDQFDDLAPESVSREIKAIRKHGLPLIGTIRSRAEGGKSRIPDAKRASLYQRVAQWVDAVDIELSSGDVLKRARPVIEKHKNVLIISYHHFSGTPADTQLAEIVDHAVAEGADIIKIATFTESEDDVLRLLNFTSKHRAKHLVSIAMGAKGTISRLVFPLAGSLMTYTSTAPADGQVPLSTLIDDLRLYYPRFNEAMIDRLKLLEYA